MATPTAGKHGASQQGRTPSHFAAATPPVSTPFSNPAHAAFSPRGPRTSPQQVKKSPAMMNHASNGALSFDSPSTAVAMGLNLSGGLDLGGLDNVGALSGLGQLNTEDDKLKRLETILEILNKKKGFVSEKGLERLSQRIGLDCLVEDYTALNGRKMKTLIIAGANTQIDIILDNNVVQSVALTFPDLSPTTSQHMEAASPILLKNLRLASGQSPLTKTLDKFAANLERLASLDKLSIMPSLDCREALAGVYASLDRLHKWDTSKLRELPELGEKTDEYVSTMAMSTKHGQPTMHARGRVGLAVQYWKELRHIPGSSESTALLAEANDKVWALLIGCAPIEGLGIPPIRVSENWISTDIVKEEGPDGMKTQMLDWQEPDNVSLPASDDNKDAGMDMLQPDLSTTRVPQVMFTVTFDPPIILPQSDWARLYAYAQIDPPNLFAYPPTFDHLFFPLAPGSTQDPSELRTIPRQRDVRVFDRDGNNTVVAHNNQLYIYKQIYSQAVSEMPFSHPKQLIDMLPLLRQYAFTSTLLENSFGSSTREAPAAPATGDIATAPKPAKSEVVSSTTRQELADFMGPSRENATSIKLPDGISMDVILWVHPLPHLKVVFPYQDKTATVSLSILENGVVDVVDENILSADGETKGKGKQLSRADLGKLLECMEDLCKWVEWIRTRLV